MCPFSLRAVFSGPPAATMPGQPLVKIRKKQEFDNTIYPDCFLLPFSITSWNGRGIYAVDGDLRYSKMRYVKELMANHDIALLQEAHMAWGKHKAFIDELRHNATILVNHFTQAALGTAIIIKNNWLKHFDLQVEHVIITKVFSHLQVKHALQ